MQQQRERQPDLLLRRVKGRAPPYDLAALRAEARTGPARTTTASSPAHAKAGTALPAAAGELVVQGEDLGTWITAQRAGWDRLKPAQQYLLETLSIEPPEKGEMVVPVRRSQDERWAVNLAAARQFHAREGHLRPARKQIELINVTGGREGMQEAVKLGAFIDNSRRRAATLSPQRRAALDDLGMRW
ncbi:helicase associated domain-containing protein [Streptomyces sp. NPDC002701]|uniref:helicase associated domain-containing protein n=1 Tax=Streptomyces sp. NPDC002701 TaxID=3364661 RepID=UPI0036990369